MYFKYRHMKVFTLRPDTDTIQNAEPLDALSSPFSPPLLYPTGPLYSLTNIGLYLLSSSFFPTGPPLHPPGAAKEPRAGRRGGGDEWGDGRADTTYCTEALKHVYAGLN